MQPPEGWTWWIFSVLGVGAVVSIVSNLASNHLQKLLDNFSEQRRQRRMEEDESGARYVDEMVKLAEADSTVLTVMASSIEIWQTRAVRMLMLGHTLMIASLVFSMSLSTGTDWMSMAARWAGVVGFFFSFFILNLGRKIQKKAELYADVIVEYHVEHHIKKVINAQRSDRTHLTTMP